LSDRPGRELQVLAYSDSRIFSGAEAVMRDVVAGLARRPGFRVQCAAPRENTALWEALTDSFERAPLDVPSQPLRVAATHLYDPLRRRRTARVLAESGADVLLANLPSAEYGGTPLLLWPAERPAVGFLHVAGSPHRLGFRLGRLREALARRPLRRLDAVCVLGDSAARTYEELWNGKETLVRTVRLPRPELQRSPAEQARAALGLPQGPMIGIAGRVSIKQKGHDTFVEAAQQMSRKRADLSFAIAGEGRDADSLQRSISERGLGDRFHLLGQVEISAFLSAIDAIALPSRFEGLPVVALEALQLGVPGIAAASDGLADVWPEPWQVPASDPAALGSALERLLEAPAEERARLLEEGRRRAHAATTTDVAADVAAVIDEVAVAR
jgi:glycosyltransferase involved in cell wall biosynthesis